MRRPKRRQISDSSADKDADPDFIEVILEVPDILFDEDELDDLAEPKLTKPKADDCSPEAYDQYLSHGGESARAQVTK